MKVFWCSNFSKMLPRCGRVAHICGANETVLFPVTSRRQRKSFLVQQFFKNAAEVWASSPHLRSKRNCTMKEKQKSRRKSEESQLPSKSEGCNERYGFRGNCDSEGKLGMCPSLAEPDSGGIPKSIVFDYKPQAAKHFNEMHS